MAMLERESDPEREGERHTYIYGESQCVLLSGIRGMFPLRASTSGIHNSILALQQTDKKRERERERERERAGAQC